MLLTSSVIVALSASSLPASATGTVTRAYSAVSCKGGPSGGPLDSSLAVNGAYKGGLAQQGTCPFAIVDGRELDVDVEVFDYNSTSGNPGKVKCTLFAEYVSGSTTALDFDDVESTGSSGYQLLSFDTLLVAPGNYADCTSPDPQSGNISGILGFKVSHEVDCTDDSECGDYRCDSGTCLVGCTVDSECAEGLGCSGGSCIEPECDADGDCAPYKCSEHLCTTSCSNNAGCSGGTVCVGSACVVPQCTANSQCGGYLCTNYQCTTSCSNNGQCAAGKVCNSSQCITPQCLSNSQCGGYLCNNGLCGTSCTSVSECFSLDYDCTASQCILDCGLYASFDNANCLPDCRNDTYCAPHAHCTPNDTVCEEDYPGCEEEDDPGCL